MKAGPHVVAVEAAFERRGFEGLGRGVSRGIDSRPLAVGAVRRGQERLGSPIGPVDPGGEVGDEVPLSPTESRSGPCRAGPGPRSTRRRCRRWSRGTGTRSGPSCRRTAPGSRGAGTSATARRSGRRRWPRRAGRPESRSRCRARNRRGSRARAGRWSMRPPAAGAPRRSSSRRRRRAARRRASTRRAGVTSVGMVLFLSTQLLELEVEVGPRGDETATRDRGRTCRPP